MPEIPVLLEQPYVPRPLALSFRADIWRLAELFELRLQRFVAAADRVFEERSIARRGRLREIRHLAGADKRAIQLRLAMNRLQSNRASPGVPDQDELVMMETPQQVLAQLDRVRHDLLHSQFCSGDLDRLSRSALVPLHDQEILLKESIEPHGGHFGLARSAVKFQHHRA